MDCSTPGFAVLYYIPKLLLRLMSVELMIPSNHLIHCCPLHRPLVFPSIRIFSSELALPTRWPKYWSFSCSPSSENSVMVSFRIDWVDLLAVQGTLESFLAPQFESTNSLALSLLYGPTLMFRYNHCKNHSFDYMDLCQESRVSAF